MDDVLKIALGVFIGALAAAFAWEGIQTLRVKIALEQAAIEMRKADADAQEQANRRAKAAYENQRRENLETERRIQESREREQLEILRRQDKEAAFKKFYQPSPACQADPVQTVCANAYIKAKTVFESQYVPSR